MTVIPIIPQNRYVTSMCLSSQNNEPIFPIITPVNISKPRVNDYEKLHSHCDRWGLRLVQAIIHVQHMERVIDIQTMLMNLCITGCTSCPTGYNAYNHLSDQRSIASIAIAGIFCKVAVRYESKALCNTCNTFVISVRYCQILSYPVCL